MRMTKHIHESNLIEGYDDPEFDKQSMKAWDYLSEQTHLTLADIRKVQKIITLKQTDLQPDWRGYWRTIPVYVGGREAPFQILIPELMQGWLENFMQDTPKAAHIKFEKIHPFVDGNGRTGRMLMWWHELRRGETPTLILNSKKQEYYKWFK